MIRRSERLNNKEKKYSDCFKQVKINKSIIAQNYEIPFSTKSVDKSIRSIKLNTHKIKSPIIDLSNDSDDDKDSIIDYTEFDITSYMNSIDDESAKIIKDYFSEITRDLNQVFFYIPNNGKPKYLMQKFIDAILIFCPNAEFKIKQLDRTLNELNITWQHGEMNDAIYCYSDIEDDCVIV